MSCTSTRYCTSERNTESMSNDMCGGLVGGGLMSPWSDRPKEQCCSPAGQTLFQQFTSVGPEVTK